MVRSSCISLIKGAIGTRLVPHVWHGMVGNSRGARSHRNEPGASHLSSWWGRLLKPVGPRTHVFVHLMHVQGVLLPYPGAWVSPAVRVACCCLRVAFAKCPLV